MTNNWYAPPQAEVLDSADTAADEAEVLRRAHVRHEVHLKSIGALYYLSGGLMALACVSMLVSVMSMAHLQATPPSLWLMVLIYVVISTLSFVIGWGFRGLRPWVRVPGGVLAALGLLAIPIGTLINGWVLYLMFGRKGQVVLSPEYQAVIAATPQVKYQRTVGDWIATGILVVLLLSIVVLFVIGALRG